MLYKCENGRRTINSVPKERKSVMSTSRNRGVRITKAQIAEIQSKVDNNFNQLLSDSLS